MQQKPLLPSLDTCSLDFGRFLAVNFIWMVVSPIQHDRKLEKHLFAVSIFVDILSVVQFIRFIHGFNLFAEHVYYM